jgi:hypothetical protein
MNLKSTPLTLYWMTCGCVRRYEELDKNRNPYKCRCIEKGRIDYRTTECKVCGKRFEFDKMGATPVYCPVCRIICKIPTRSKKEPSESIDLYIMRHPNALASEKRYDCVSRDGCILKYETRQVLPCLGCNQYQSRGR